MSLKTHAAVWSHFFKRSKVLSLLVVVFGTLSIVLNFAMTEHVLTIGIVILDALIICLLYGFDVQRSTNLAEKVYNYMNEEKKEMSPENAKELTMGLTAKDSFWVFAVSTIVLGAVNMWLPRARLLTYCLFDAVFFLAMAYGLQASWLLKSFSANIGVDLLKEHLGEK